MTAKWPLGLTLAAVLITGAPAAEPRVAEPRCPFADDEACGEWRFQELDGQVGAMMARALAQIPAELDPALRQQTAAALAEAHQKWLEFREMECRWRVAADVLNARSRRRQLADCLLDVTWRRYGDLSRLPLTRGEAR